MTLSVGKRNSVAQGRPAGFTLMELILVMVVIAVVIGLAAPSLKGFFASRQVSYAAANMLALTKQAQSQAMSWGAPCRLNIDTKAGTFSVTIQQGGKYGPLDDKVRLQVPPLPEGVSVTVDMPSPAPVQQGTAGGASMGRQAQALLRNADASQDELYVYFYPNGRHDVATIEITGQQGERYQVTSAATTEAFRVIVPSESR